ncbi:MAG: hypothetical protein IIV05_07525, partial [Ruminococcus sp.]|nr:hypothetical protein [Ruminococcus sp.]
KQGNTPKQPHARGFFCTFSTALSSVPPVVIYSITDIIIWNFKTFVKHKMKQFVFDNSRNDEISGDKPRNIR